MQNERYYTKKDVARKLGVSVKTVTRWQRKGWMPPPLNTPGRALGPGRNRPFAQRPAGRATV